MFKAIMTTKENQTIYLEYDKEKYNFEYVKSKNAIILRRLWDNTVLEIFTGNISFIVQSNSNESTNFIVADYSDIIENMSGSVKIKHYVDRGFDSLKLVNQFEHDGSTLEQCRVAESSFIVEQQGYGGSIYNLSKKSQNFDYLYNDEKINEIIGRNILMVSEVKTADYNSEIKDTITYGIDPETFEIVTPIWSELQQRYIEIYTEEHVAKIKEEHPFFNVGNLSLGDITIYFEIEEYLEKLVPHFKRNHKIYLEYPEKINEEFVRKFVRK